MKEDKNVSSWNTMISGLCSNEMIFEAKKLFDEMLERDEVSWSAIIDGYNKSGYFKDALELFNRMQRDEEKPNDITFVALLNACAHAGLVQEGLKYFVSMKQTYLVEPTVEHYGCVVNLLGKRGYFKEAEDLIDSMPMKPNSAVWGAFLCACRKHNNVELGERVGEMLLDLEPGNSGRYALLSNIYAKAGKFDRAERVRLLMKERGLKTVTGQSSIELNGVVHEFKAGDYSHPQMRDIDRMVGKIVREIKLKGYRRDVSQVLLDISEEEKETSLKYHSEKLAISFGILNTERGDTIRVVKNLRVCEDCHSAMKIISRVYEREIIMRDRVRYHRFKDGQCSCMDFW
ncbi:pentatricopeptide repeat-containing protein at5g48910 [Phtheirospermum japonicum]|uniref:Pentatricopeptide repeat-containing protein at5g48910 n=1 Tax=Phtheirospermum japonicum TaxID=374723 RepID=A0A830B5T5_9LAMI|nr:pentatricopeptide repeat-containing protein at5g48910 [Phtheirospermum japonicum]